MNEKQKMYLGLLVKGEELKRAAYNAKSYEEFNEKTYLVCENFTAINEITSLLSSEEISEVIKTQ